MADLNPPTTRPDPSDGAPQGELEQGTYEIIRHRLKTHAQTLRERMHQLNDARRAVFGSIPTQLLSTQRITTAYNCTPQDIAPVGNLFLFGYNVHMGLKKVTDLQDVFSIYRFGEDGMFHETSLEPIQDPTFQQDFFQLYKYYKETRFTRFYQNGPYLYFVFQIGRTPTDIKAFKFLIEGDQLTYIDNRSDHEIVYPPQHDFKWTRTHRELHRNGVHPHISIEDRVFVETVGGDLTIKIEDNTDDGEGIYSEPVDDPDQSLDDGEIYYAIVGNIILLKIRPFKEEAFRYLVYNEKTQSVVRIDAIADACVLLPEDHGLIFSNGYYLQTGLSKTFDSDTTDLLFERRIASPNGEDYLYVFYNRQLGQYVLLSYNMIQQEVETPIVCNGYSIFENGHLIFFKSSESPQKHHAIQCWQTPYVGDSVVIGEKTDSYIFKIGNKDIVRAMAESHEVLNLIDQDDTYANLYHDLVKKTTDLLDTYFWLKEPDTFNLAEPVGNILEAATTAVDEFEKVVRVRRNTTQQFESVSRAAQKLLTDVVTRPFRHIDDFVERLASLRSMRGQVISLKELKYIDLEAVEKLETKIAETTDNLSRRCVAFLLKEDSLAPYIQRIAQQRDQIPQLKTALQGRELGEKIAAGASELEMLIEIVSNLQIDDATERTRIIDAISAIYSNLNQVRAALQQKQQALMAVEGEAEFHSELKLMEQAVANYLNICDSPDRCDEYLTKLMVQIEEVEGRFAEFDPFVVQLAEKREEIYTAFETKKLQLIDARNRRATALMAAADRILKGIRSRVSNFETVDQIHSYFAADLMIEKVRDLIGQLEALDESVKVDDIQSRLKTIREDTVRQLRDKNELYVAGQNVIQFGPYHFSVNTQALELTTVLKDDQMFFHLAGTNYFEPVDHAPLLATRPVWGQQVVSENRDVYRAEYLAFKLLSSWNDPHAGSQTEEPHRSPPSPDDLLTTVQQFMAPRYTEGYVKGVHDHDAAKILAPLASLDRELHLLKYDASNRVLAHLFWLSLGENDPARQTWWHARLDSLSAARNLFGTIADSTQYVTPLADEIEAAQQNLAIGPSARPRMAARYLFELLSSRSQPVCSQPAQQLMRAFKKFLNRKKAENKFAQSIESKSFTAGDRFQVIRDWIAAFASSDAFSDAASVAPPPATSDSAEPSVSNQAFPRPSVIDEVALMLTDRSDTPYQVVDISTEREISGLMGDHPRIVSNRYHLDYHQFMDRLTRFDQEVVPAFTSYLQLKKEVMEQRREALRLDQFKPRVLTSFVRNQLINDTYLPMIGANLAKQIGVVGEQKRTDLMGLLLLISPPGYGKTTLMEYVANRLGITFMKINGPAIGHLVTSLDPDEAPHASAREEIEKLNLALEMGDNVMIYVDDIQHCNPEFLQKFISLCDGTRRIEGVFNGRTRTYDLRGRKVAVVMAGNPYTESGEKFQIPDMLASRADTYNLGDVIGDNQESFELSYLENSLTSNPTLSRLNAGPRNDVFTVIQMAQRDDSQTLTLEGSYSIDEVNAFVSVMKKLITARDVILKVNQQYIESAAQADAYRTEPPFKLQGSYRDMNKIAERIAPIMNAEELNALIVSHYQNQAQTLASDAQANLLKLKELLGTLSKDERKRWNAICHTFQRNLLLGAAGSEGELGQIIAQMTTFSEGLHQIRLALETGLQHHVADDEDETHQVTTPPEMNQAVGELVKFNTILGRIEQTVSQGLEAAMASAKTGERPPIEIVNKVPNIFLDIIRNQFRVLQTWMDPILELSEAIPEAQRLKEAAQATERNYQRLLKKISED